MATESKTAKKNGKQEASATAPKTIRDHALRVDIGITDKDLERLVHELNAILANNTLLAVKTKNYHWNVTGIQFNELHKFFEKQYNQLAQFQDEVAERIRQLGGRPLGNMQQFIAHATLREEERDKLDAISMLRSLLADHEEVIKQMRETVEASEEKYGDAGTADFVTGLMEEHEKMAWMIRAMCE